MHGLCVFYFIHGTCFQISKKLYANYGKKILSKSIFLYLHLIKKLSKISIFYMNVKNIDANRLMQASKNDYNEQIDCN